MSRKKPQINNGKLLLAEPFLVEPNFRRAVVLLCEHQEAGSIGFILNKPLHMKVNDLVSDFPEIDSKVYYGGPVATDTIHYVHNVGELLEDSIEVERGIYWGGDFEKLKFLIDSKLIKSQNIRFYVGYSGWSEGQLDEEFFSGTWMTANADPNHIFKSNSRKLWRKVLTIKGDRYSVIANMPDPISLN